jgi:hypothetical protein
MGNAASDNASDDDETPFPHANPIVVSKNLFLKKACNLQISHEMWYLNTPL